MARVQQVPFGPKKVMDSPPSKPLRTAPYKQQVHWLFYVPAYAYAYAYVQWAAML